MLFKTIASSLIGIGGAITFTLGTIQSAFAISFTDAFGVNNFNFTYSPNNAATSANNLDISHVDSTGEVIIYGANNDPSPDYTGNGLGDLSAKGGATVNWTINVTSARAGNISFDWTYNSLDPAIDDTAGYLLNGTYYVLGTKDGDTSIGVAPVSLSLSNNDVFGFRVSTNSNTGGYGYLTVNNFQATPTPVPFESSANSSIAILALLGGFWGVQRYRTSLIRRR